MHNYSYKKAMVDLKSYRAVWQSGRKLKRLSIPVRSPTNAGELMPLNPSQLLIECRLTSLPSPGDNVVMASRKSTIARKLHR